MQSDFPNLREYVYVNVDKTNIKYTFQIFSRKNRLSIHSRVFVGQCDWNFNITVLQSSKFLIHSVCMLITECVLRIAMQFHFHGYLSGSITNLLS